MTKQQLDHVLRAAGRITGARQFVIVGSQALHGKHPDLPDQILGSAEVDLIAKDDVSRTDLLNAIGQDSPLHVTFGYYADPVDEATAVLPRGCAAREGSDVHSRVGASPARAAGPVTDTPADDSRRRRGPFPHRGRHRARLPTLRKRIATRARSCSSPPHRPPPPLPVSLPSRDNPVAPYAVVPRAPCRCGAAQRRSIRSAPAARAAGDPLPCGRRCQVASDAAHLVCADDPSEGRQISDNSAKTPIAVNSGHPMCLPRVTTASNRPTAT